MNASNVDVGYKSNITYFRKKSKSKICRCEKSSDLRENRGKLPCLVIGIGKMFLSIQTRGRQGLKPPP
jgi:hypothetical protein